MSADNFLLSTCSLLNLLCDHPYISGRASSRCRGLKHSKSESGMGLIDRLECSALLSSEMEKRYGARLAITGGQLDDMSTTEQQIAHRAMVSEPKLRELGAKHEIVAQTSIHPARPANVAYKSLLCMCGYHALSDGTKEIGKRAREATVTGAHGCRARQFLTTSFPLSISHPRAHQNPSPRPAQSILIMYIDIPDEASLKALTRKALQAVAKVSAL